MGLYVNFLSGNIISNPLTNVATLINSTGFASMPVITAPDLMWVTLDPLGSAGAPEIVKVPAHFASVDFFCIKTH